MFATRNETKLAASSCAMIWCYSQLAAQSNRGAMIYLDIEGRESLLHDCRRTQGLCSDRRKTHKGGQ